MDGACELIGLDSTPLRPGAALVPPIGSVVTGVVVETDGVDLLVEPS